MSAVLEPQGLADHDHSHDHPMAGGAGYTPQTTKTLAPCICGLASPCLWSVAFSHWAFG